MRLVRTAIFAGLASAALAGAAFAARDDHKVMLVALPDGSVQHIRYEGEVAPRLVLIPAPAPASLVDVAFGPGSPFAEMERISAMMEARSQAMLREAAALQAQLPATPGNGPGIVMTNADGQPVGVMHYSFTSSSISADGCTRTVSYSSDGAAAPDQPRVIRTSSGTCAEARSAPASPVTPTKASPAARPAPKITPISLPAELKAFTPSRT